MKINELKNLKPLDVIAKNLTNDKKPTYEIYYVWYNDKEKYKITVAQGYYDSYNERNILLQKTVKEIDYDELLHFDLIHKRGRDLQLFYENEVKL